MFDYNRRALVGAGLCLPLAAVVNACASTNDAPLTLDALIARHVTARGGAPALDRVQSCAIDLEITEGGQTINGRYYARTDRLARIDIIVGGQRVYSEGVDSQGVWLWPADEPAPRASVAEGAANALLHGVETNLVGLHRFQHRGARLVLAPRETLDDIEYHVVECTFATGHVTNFYIDPTSWLITRKRDQRAYHPDADTTMQHVESRFSDWVEVEGVLAAHRNDDFDIDRNTLLSTARVLARRINPDLPEGLFERTHVPT